MAAYSSSTIGVFSIYQTNSPLDHSKRPSSTPPLCLHFSTAESPFRSFSSAVCLKTFAGASNSFVTSAVATPNSLILSEEAFKGFSEFRRGVVSESEYEEDEGGLDGNEGVGMDELEVSKLGLPTRLVETLQKRGITQLFPIQRAVLVPALEGQDIIGRAMTGTGKTLAFGIPIIKGLDDLEQEAF